MQLLLVGDVSLAVGVVPPAAQSALPVDGARVPVPCLHYTHFGFLPWSHLTLLELRVAPAEQIANLRLDVSVLLFLTRYHTHVVASHCNVEDGKRVDSDGYV